MLRLVVTARPTGPICARMATYNATSARANMAGPEIVPPGRRLRWCALRRNTALIGPTLTRSIRLTPPSVSCGNSRARKAAISPAVIFGAEGSVAEVMCGSFMVGQKRVVIRAAKGMD